MDSDAPSQIGGSDALGRDGAQPSALRRRWHSPAGKQVVAFVLVLAAGLGLTWKWMWLEAQHEAETVASSQIAEFDDEVQQCETALEVRLQRYRVALRGSQGLFAASKSVERSEWRAYAHTVMDPAHFPSAKAIAVITRVPAEMLEEFLQKTRADEAPDFTVRPPIADAPGRDEHWLITHEAHGETADSLIGLDLVTEPAEVEAMQQARDTNLPHATVCKLRADGTAETDLIVYLPIYTNGMPYATLDQRRAALWGWASLRIEVRSLINEAGIAQHLLPGHELRMYAGEVGVGTLPGLLNDNDPAHTISAPDTRGLLERTFTVPVIGLPLTARLTMPQPEVRPWAHLPWSLAAFGAAASLMAAAFVTSLVRMRQRAEATAAELEKTVRERTAELEASEARYRTLFDSIDEGFCIIEMIFDEQENPIDYRFVEINPSFENQTGLRDAVGKRMRELAPGHEKHWFEIYGRIAVTGEPARFQNHAAQLHRWFDVYAFRLGEPKDRQVAILFRNITEERYLESALRNAKAAADLASQAKSEFLANMSHEIRTPMAAVIGYADLLLDPEQSTSERLNYVNIIRRNAEHLLTVINDILDISKIEAGKMTVERIACEPRRIIADVTSLMRVRAAQKNLTFVVGYDGPIPLTIQSDPTRLRQILINLISNAVKFTETGGVRVSVKLLANQSQPLLRFEIEDSGIGMSAEHLHRIFESFEQGDSSTTRRFGGSGLGLAICKRLTALLGGDITVESELGHGSRFVCTVQTGSLDGVPMMDDPREAATMEQPVMQGQLRLQGRVLLAEDGPDNQQLFTAYLRRAECHVTIAGNGRIACEKALEAVGSGNPFDLILMDMQMPELDGYGAAALLRAKGYKGPIVALTAHAMAEDRAKCINSGCTDYLTKPISRETLIQSVARYLKPTTDESAPICSTAEDEDRRELLPQFIDHLPGQVGRLQTLLARQDLQELSQAVHQLKGTGGLYGFMSISESAARAEQALRRCDSIEFVTREVDELVSIIRRVQNYDRSKEPSFNPEVSST